MSFVTRFSKLHASAANICHFFRSPLLLAIRLYWGLQLAHNGWGKLHNIAGVTDFFTTLGLPQPHLTAIFVSLVECVGGTLFALGLGGRMISLVLLVNMTVAFWVAEKDVFLGIFSNPDKFVVADAFIFWFAALLILIFGPGYLAIDTLLGKWHASRQAGISHA